MRFNKLTLITLLVITVAIAIIYQSISSPRDSRSTPSNSTSSRDFTPSNNNNRNTDSTPSFTSLYLPFNLDDINLTQGDLNPLGVVRFDQDQSDYGHSGIDIPLAQGSNIFASTNGQIVLLGTAGDPWGGMKIGHLIEPTNDGEGWIFIYEHVTPLESLSIGDNVSQGDLIATKTAPNNFTAHFQLSYHFNEYEYSKNIQCWPDYLQVDEKSKLDAWWSTYSQSNSFHGDWSTNVEDGKYPFRGLLDRQIYPNGPQYCYSLGTDVR